MTAGAAFYEVVMDSWLHPALVFFVGSLLVPLLKERSRQVVLLLVPLLALLLVAGLTEGVYGEVGFLGLTLTFGRVDKLALVFAWVFTIMALLGAIYGLHVREAGHHAAGQWYAGSALGAVFAGDYLTLFLFWELMAFSSVFLIWYRRTPGALAAGYRYLLFHVFGGVCLLAGIMLAYAQTGSLAFIPFSPAETSLASYLILAGFGLNAAVLPLHAWLPDAYPEATVEGAVLLCAFTTKTAVYVLARGFAGFEILAALGVAMTIFGVIYAVIENDMRRVLAYHIVSQVGYMVAGIGMGTAMSVNGACAHAFAHILYKALLFMGAGAVLYMAGTAKLSQLGGLARFMPLTMLFYVIGAVSISGFPLFSGFTSKSMILAAAHEEGRLYLMALMSLAAIGTFLSVGLKVTYFAFFSREPVTVVREAPANMLVAMGLTAALCFLLGVYPEPLYALLPAEVTWRPYTWHHLAEAFQLLTMTGLVFWLMVKKLAPEEKINLDVDYFYRKGAASFVRFDERVLAPVDGWWGDLWKRGGLRFLSWQGRMAGAFDRIVIDGLVDGCALVTLAAAARLRKLQTGALQTYLGLAVVFFFLVMIFWVA
jgi:multicomponent Na+:H+ antiporter subunit D